ncbi:hypothetical protein IV500_04220 [Paeniglutamicibacter antarcticus]|uniref:Uncharacterized protein n=1 Tax=Arthrobacter terrae TaxID=2935737 RepID=A0A931G3F9_9MICC|nr:hypothetical protein [Arthrobacter terrae]MBG0738626.1 hypothetical protein [Arthrobacter terrae]
MSEKPHAENMAADDDRMLAGIRARAEARNTSGLIGGVREWSDINHLLGVIDRLRVELATVHEPVAVSPDGHAPTPAEYPEELFDEDGYPSDEALAYLDAFPGSPNELIDYVAELMAGYGSVRRSDIEDYWGQPKVEVKMVTGGWSGCEQVLSHLAQTMFHFCFWESSSRGGAVVYRLRPADLHLAGLWCNPKHFSQKIHEE